MKNNLLIDHIGWTTDDTELFESFWCNVIGYKLVKVSDVLPELCYKMFGFKSNGIIRRYSNENIGPDIEIHKFFNGNIKTYMGFNRVGINHICIYTGNKNSREEFIKNLPRDIEVLEYENPGGWANYFIRDYEGNWIELRENFDD